MNDLGVDSSPPTITADVDMDGAVNGIDDCSEQRDNARPSARFGSKSRDLIKVIQKLEALGIDATLPSLPKFVIVGDQSQGKSSIIEAICEITLPRGPGTCTRCPYQITTSASPSGNSAWSCKIFLHRKHSYDPSFKAGRGQPGYDRWPQNESLNAVLFATISDKAHLEDVLVRAQLAILNPATDPASFMNGHLPAKSRTQVGFSPNVVALKIQGPDLPELSFLDLPGAISYHSDESQQHLVPFVGDLIKNYLSDKKALVLLACSADQDVENSTAFGFIGQCGAQARCMGVLTKPDLLIRSRFPYIYQILNGENFRLANGWYVTKQNSQEELDLSPSHAKARDREQIFFNGPPWSTTWQNFDQYFGIHNLQDAISNKLTAHILHDLPEIMARVETRLQNVEALLAQFPAQPPSASHAVMDQIHCVASVIVEHIKGDGLDVQFRSDYKELLRGLRAQLKQLQPVVILGTPGYKKPSIDLLSDDEMDESPTPVQSTPSSKRSKGINGRAVPTSAQSETATPRKLKAELPSRDAHASNVFKLDQVKAALDKTSTPLSDQVDPRIINNIIKQCLTSWHYHVAALMDRVKTLLQHMTGQSIHSALATRQHTQLYAKTTEAIDKFMIDLFY